MSYYSSIPLPGYSGLGTAQSTAGNTPVGNAIAYYRNQVLERANAGDYTSPYDIPLIANRRDMPEFNTWISANPGFGKLSALNGAGPEGVSLLEQTTGQNVDTVKGEWDNLAKRGYSPLAYDQWGKTLESEATTPGSFVDLFGRLITPGSKFGDYTFNPQGYRMNFVGSGTPKTGDNNGSVFQESTDASPPGTTAKWENIELPGVKIKDRTWSLPESSVEGGYGTNTWYMDPQHWKYSGKEPASSALTPVEIQHMLQRAGSIPRLEWQGTMGQGGWNGLIGGVIQPISAGLGAYFAAGNAANAGNAAINAAEGISAQQAAYQSAMQAAMAKAGTQAALTNALGAAGQFAGGGGPPISPALGGISGGIASGLGATGMSPLLAKALASAGLGAGMAGMRGGNPWYGGLTSGLSSGMGMYGSGINPALGWAMQQGTSYGLGKARGGRNG